MAPLLAATCGRNADVSKAFSLPFLRQSYKNRAKLRVEDLGFGAVCDYELHLVEKKLRFILM